MISITTIPTPSTVLLVGADATLLQDITRLAAAAAVAPDVVGDPLAALAAWPRAGTVLVADDLVGDLALLDPPRRQGVHVVSRGSASLDCFRDALLIGAESVAELPAQETWLVELLTDVGDGADAGAGQVLGVMGGSGGVGASVFAAALAESIARDRPTLLLDADRCGAGLDRLLGMENAPGIRWDVLSQSSGRLSGRSMRDSLPHRGDLAVLSWPSEAPEALHPSAMREVMSAGVRGFGTVVVDLPRHHDPVLEEAVSRCDELIVVVSASVAGVASARRTLARLPRSTPRHLLVRTRRGGVDPDEISDVLGAPLLATLRDDRGLTEALDLGLGPLRSARGPMATACRAAWLGLRAAVR